MRMSPTMMSRLLSNAARAESRLAELKTKVAEIRQIKLHEKIVQLTAENKSLETQVQQTKQELIRLETLNGKKQYPLPMRNGEITASDAVPKATSVNPAVDNVGEARKGSEGGKAKKEKAAPKPVPTEAPVDVGRLDLRVGKIVEVAKHPDADSLYVEKIDCGEGNPRTVVSGLVNHVPIDEMRDRLVMVLCNLKPVKMRGVTSEAMVMCASSPEKVEVLIPPAGAAPGDLVHCDGYPRVPDPQLNPKKKIFETCAPDLKTDNNAVACYKGTPLQVPGKGNVAAKSLKGVSVK